MANTATEALLPLTPGGKLRETRRKQSGLLARKGTGEECSGSGSHNNTTDHRLGHTPYRNITCTCAATKPKSALHQRRQQQLGRPRGWRGCPVRQVKAAEAVVATRRPTSNVGSPPTSSRSPSLLSFATTRRPPRGLLHWCPRSRGWTSRPRGPRNKGALRRRGVKAIEDHYLHHCHCC